MSSGAAATSTTAKLHFAGTSLDLARVTTCCKARRFRFPFSRGGDAARGRAEPMSEGSGLTARDQQELEEFMRQAFFENAIIHGELAEVQLLSSEGARRITHRGESAEQLATQLGHHEVAAWLRATHNWTELHHVEFLPPERTREMLRGGGDIHAEVKPFGVTPLSIAQDLEAAARPVIHRADLHGFDEILAPRIHNALLVLEAAKPWSRKTHTLFPAAARERAADLMRVGQWL